MFINYGWTIKGIDNERGIFGEFRNFGCSDDRLAPPRLDEEMARRRWGTQCASNRQQGENLGAMVVVTWVNPRHGQPVTAEGYQQQVANRMAIESQNNAEARCEGQKIEVFGRGINLVDCSMILPFGTYFMSYINFENSGIEYYIRAANASAKPDALSPKEKIRKILKLIRFASDDATKLPDANLK